MSAALMHWPAVTATPDRVRLPAPGKVVMVTALSALAGLSLGSVKPKSAVTKVYAVFSLVVTVLLVPAGASFTARDVDGQGVGRGIQIYPAIGRPTIVLHLEGEAGIARAVGVGRRGEEQCPRRYRPG